MMRLLTVADTRAIDAAAVAAGISIDVLMARAGAAVAQAIARRWTPRPVHVLCGPGANGGDGWVAARTLRDAGWPVRCYALAPREALSGAERRAADAFGPALPAEQFAPETGAIVIDALFGAGLSRPLEGDAARLASLCAGPARQVVAIDTPSGVPGDGGRPEGVTFHATLTVTFVAKKPAHVLEPGRALCGEVVVADIGVGDGAATSLLYENGPAIWRAPVLDRAVHKFARGHVMVAGGPRGRTGAARLAARAALRAGAGVVTILTPPDALAEYAAHATAVMVHAAETAALAARAAQASALIAGPALGADAGARARLEAVLATGRPAVLDADVFSIFAANPEGLAAAAHPACILTPHLGEFRRVFGDADPGASKIARAQAASKLVGAVTLLKGPDTVIAAPDGRAAVNTTGVADLATAGSGDVLAGFIGAFLGQGMAPFEAACAGAWLHGRIGEVLGPGLIAEDLPEAAPRVLQRLAAKRTAT